MDHSNFGTPNAQWRSRCCFRQLTDIRRAERQLQQSQQRLEDAVESLADGFAVFDPSDRLVMCNEKYKEFFPLLAPALVQGATYEAILRFGLAQGQYPDETERAETWIASAPERTRREQGSARDIRLSDGR